MTASENTVSIVVGGGCFWCIEAIFIRFEGVVSAKSGYAGGLVPNPSYEQVSSGKSGHAEVVRITFNPDMVSLDEILDFFFQAHDPTTLNRQGADAGTQYRSIILFSDNSQEEAAKRAIGRAQAHYQDTVVTEVKRLEYFYPAEDYHQDYYEKNKSAGYCAFVISPKLEKLRLENK